MQLRYCHFAVWFVRCMPRPTQRSRNLPISNPFWWMIGRTQESTRAIVTNTPSACGHILSAPHALTLIWCLMLSGPACTLHNLLDCNVAVAASSSSSSQFIYLFQMIHSYWIPITAQCHEIVIKNVRFPLLPARHTAHVLVFRRSAASRIAERRMNEGNDALSLHKSSLNLIISYRWMSSVGRSSAV